MSRGWNWKRKQPAPTAAQMKQASKVPFVVQPQTLYTQRPVVTSPYGESYDDGRPAYAEPPSYAVQQTIFATIGQFNPAQIVGPWVYSPGLPTPSTIFDVIGGNPPVGGFTEGEQLGSV